MKITDCTPAMRSTGQLFLVWATGDSLIHWGRHHCYVRGLSLPRDYSPSPPPKRLSCVHALSPNLGGGKQCLHHVASTGYINMSTWSMDSCLWLWHWALSASSASILEKNKYFSKIASKLAIYAAQVRKTAQEFLIHSSHSLGYTSETTDMHMLYSKCF